MLSRNLADLFQDFLPIFCQVKGIQTPVIRVCSSFHEPPLLEFVQYRDQAAGVNLQLRCQLLLAESCGKTVTIKGKVAERGGMVMLENAEVVKK